MKKLMLYKPDCPDNPLASVCQARSCGHLFRLRLARPLQGLMAVALCFSAYAAQGGNEVYVCTDSTGARVYQNTGSAGEQCRRLNLEPVLTVPQPAQRSAGQVGLGVQGGDARRGSPQGQTGLSTQGSSPRPADATAVVPSSAGAQSRETDRIRILESELREEERRLQSLIQRQQAAPEDKLVQDIARSQASLDALRREIGKVRKP